MCSKEGQRVGREQGRGARTADMKSATHSGLGCYPGGLLCKGLIAMQFKGLIAKIPIWKLSTCRPVVHDNTRLVGASTSSTVGCVGGNLSLESPPQHVLPKQQESGVLPACPPHTGGIRSPLKYVHHTQQESGVLPSMSSPACPPHMAGNQECLAL